MDHSSVSGTRFQENFNEQGKQEDNRHFSLVVIGFSLGLRGLWPGSQRWDCSCQQVTKEMESTRIKGCLFFSDGFHSNRFCCHDGTEKEGCARTGAEMWEHRQQNAVRAIKSNERSPEPPRSC